MSFGLIWEERCQSGRRNCFHSFKYVIDHANVHFFLLISLRTYSQSLNNINISSFAWFLLYHLLHIFKLDCFVALTSQCPYIFLWWYMIFFFKSSTKKLSNLWNVLQRKLRTDRPGTFRASGDTKNYLLRANLGGVFMGSIYVLACPKKLCLFFFFFSKRLTKIIIWTQFHTYIK